MAASFASFATLEVGEVRSTNSLIGFPFIDGARERCRINPAASRRGPRPMAVRET